MTLENFVSDESGCQRLYRVPPSSVSATIQGMSDHAMEPKMFVLKIAYAVMPYT